MKVLIVAPMLKEFHCAREIFTAKEISPGISTRFAKAEYKNIEIHILNTGYKPVSTLAEYKNVFSIPDLLLDTGTCGALKDSLKPGLVFQALTLFNMDGDKIDLKAIPDFELEEHSIIEVPGLVNDSSERTSLSVQADCCTMESWKVAQIAQDWDCQFICIRVVSDLADENAKKDFRLNVRPVAMHLYGVLKNILLNLSH